MSPPFYALDGSLMPSQTPVSCFLLIRTGMCVQRVTVISAFSLFKDLHTVGLVSFSRRIRARVVPFFVTKKNGDLRLAIDGRERSRRLCTGTLLTRRLVLQLLSRPSTCPQRRCHVPRLSAVLLTPRVSLVPCQCRSSAGFLSANADRDI